MDTLLNARVRQQQPQSNHNNYKGGYWSRRGLQCIPTCGRATLADDASRMMLATCGPGPPRTLGWTLIVSLGCTFVVVARCTGGTSTLSIPSGICRGNAEVAGVRGQGLGIPWPLLGCPCRLRGRLKIPELWRHFASHCGAQCCPSDSAHACTQPGSCFHSRLPEAITALRWSVLEHSQA